MLIFNVSHLLLAVLKIFGVFNVTTHTHTHVGFHFSEKKAACLMAWRQSAFEKHGVSSTVECFYGLTSLEMCFSPHPDVKRCGSHFAYLPAKKKIVKRSHSLWLESNHLFFLFFCAVFEVEPEFVWQIDSYSSVVDTPAAWRQLLAFFFNLKKKRKKSSLGAKLIVSHQYEKIKKKFWKEKKKSPPIASFFWS